jgi:hypothetical protein
LLIEGLGAALAAAMAGYIRFARGNHATKICLGVAALEYRTRLGLPSSTAGSNNQPRCGRFHRSRF